MKRRNFISGVLAGLFSLGFGYQFVKPNCIIVKKGTLVNKEYVDKIAERLGCEKLPTQPELIMKSNQYVFNGPENSFGLGIITGDSLDTLVKVVKSKNWTYEIWS